jgi:prolipoprotein diacylglyceryltransferase
MEILVRSHSGLRYVVLGLLIAAIFTAYSKWQSKDSSDAKIYSFALISTHIQLLLGLILYAMNWGAKVNFSMMKESLYRFYSVEHITGMLIAIVLITVGRPQGRKCNHKKVFTFFLIALLLILVSIPWPFRNLGGAWF